MHKAEAILDNLQTTFESIFNIGNAIAGIGNSAPPAGLCVVSGGTYSDEVDRTYTVEIVIGGESGDAKCSIIDSLALDSVVGSVVVVSGQELSLGTKGAKVTFTLSADDILTVGDKWVVQCKQYDTNIRTVIEADALPTHLETLPGIAFAFTDIPYEHYGASNKYRCDYVVVAELWIKQTDKNKIQRTLIKGLKDIEHALSLDPSRGGVAQETLILDAKPFLPVPGSPFAAISVEIGIWFDNYIK